MPWKEVTAVNERMEFVARLKAGERMSDLCREYGISRKTGYSLSGDTKSTGRRGCMTFRAGLDDWRVSYRRAFKRRF